MHRRRLVAPYIEDRAAHVIARLMNLILIYATVKLLPLSLHKDHNRPTSMVDSMRSGPLHEPKVYLQHES